jgi:MraZ protein
MDRFLGNIEAKIDTKGRIFVPATFRKQLQTASEEGLIMRKDIFQNCLVLYPKTIWNEELNELRNHLNKWNAKHQQIFRQFVSDVETINFDSNGRILLSKRYRQLVGINSQVRFIGVDKTIEIWAIEKAEESFMSAEDFANNIQELMSTEKKKDEE